MRAFGFFQQLHLNGQYYLGRLCFRRQMREVMILGSLITRPAANDGETMINFKEIYLSPYANLRCLLSMEYMSLPDIGGQRFIWNGYGMFSSVA